MMREEARGYALGAHYHLNEPFSLAIKFRLRGGKFILVHFVPDLVNDFVGGIFKELNGAKRMDAAFDAIGKQRNETVSLTAEEVSSIDAGTLVIGVAVAYGKKSVITTLFLRDQSEVQLSMDESLAVLLAGTLAQEGAKFFEGGSMSAPPGAKFQ